MRIAVWTAFRAVSILKPSRSLRRPAVDHSHERLQFEELRVFVGRVRSATGIKLIEAVITSESSRPVDLLVGEFTPSRLIISGGVHFVDDLCFRSIRSSLILPVIYSNKSLYSEGISDSCSIAFLSEALRSSAF